MTITPDVVQSIGTALLKSKQQYEREIAMCEAVADVLVPYSHYKAVNALLKTVVEAAGLGVRVYVTRHKSSGFSRTSGLNYAHWCFSGFIDEYESRVKVSICMDDGEGVAVLIARLRECSFSRDSLASVSAQFEQMEDLIDGEERICALIDEIANARKELADITSVRRIGWHPSISEHLPSLAGSRHIG